MISSNPKYNDLIDSYFDNTMSVDEREDFMIELENNEELKREFSFQMEIQQAISDTDYDNVDAVISEVLNPTNENQEATPRQSSIYQIWKYAAVILLLLAFTIFFTQYFPSEKPASALASEYFDPYPAYNTFRGESSSEELLNAAFIHYESKRYTKAKDDFHQLATQEPSNMAYIFYECNALLALEDFEAAKPLLTKVVNSNNELLIDQANWYLALCHLGTNNTEEAKTLLQKIASTQNSNYTKKAKTLLQNL